MIRDERKMNDKADLNITREGKTSRQLWNFIKKQAGWTNTTAPSLLSIEGKPITDSFQIAQTLNEYFIRKVNIISEKLPKFTMLPTYYLETLWNKWLLSDSVPMFNFHKITPNCMRQLIKKLNNSHSECCDGLSNYIVKLGEDSLVYPMTFLFNKIVETQEFPTF